MSDKVGLVFPPDQSDEWNGFNDPGIEHFAGAPYVAIGRELPQNTVDATADPDGPARLVIKLVDVPTSEIPSIKEYRDVMKRCSIAAQNESEKAKIFFANAIALLSKPKLRVLQVADYNTTGVRGPCENGAPYYALMKASGQSKKTGDQAIGSFGIGKFAPYAASALRTVFVSTVWKDGKAWRHYAQGKSVLMSHIDKKHQTRRGIGYWGIEDRCQPVADIKSLPSWLRRAPTATGLGKVAGTTINILGFDAVKGWQRMLAASIAENFFGAIHRGNLEIEIDDNIKLKAGTLASFFEDQAVFEDIRDMKDEPLKFESSKLYLRAIASPKAIVEHTENQHLGRCELRLLVEEGMPRRVAVLRDGMLITEELDKLKRFGEFKDFVAALECKSKKGNALLRAMEPPKHNDFEPDRLPTSEEKRKGRIALREIAKWVRDMLKRHAQDPVSAITNIDELKDFFADDDSAGDPSGKDGEENPVGRVVIRARPLPPPKRTPTQFEVELNGGGNGSDGGSGTGGGHTADEDSEGTGIVEGEVTGTARINLANVRAVPTSANGRRISFTPDRSGKITLAVQDSGADTNRKLSVASASKGLIKNGHIEALSVSKGTRCQLDVELEDEFEGTVRLTADAI